MVEASTGQDPSSASAPESTGKEPMNMNTSGNADPSGKETPLNQISEAILDAIELEITRSLTFLAAIRSGTAFRSASPQRC